MDAGRGKIGVAGEGKGGVAREGNMGVAWEGEGATWVGVWHERWVWHVWSQSSLIKILGHANVA